MLIIRLQPMGRRHKRHYRLVIAQKHRHVSKLVIESLGWYNPYTKEGVVNLDRYNYYNNLNVEISDTAKFVITKLTEKQNTK